MRSYRSDKVEIRTGSKIGGSGIFAREPISKGEIVCVKGGHILTDKEFQNLGSKEKQYCLQIADHLFIGPRSEDEIPENAIYINHTCEPNVGFDGEITYIALRNIDAGEELAHDYAMCFTTCLSGLLPMTCSCKSKLCRGKITGDDWKLPELHERYGNRFASFILKRLKRE